MNIDIIERLRASGWHNDFLYYMGLLASPCPAPFSGTVKEVARYAAPEVMSVIANDKMKENAEEKM